MKSECTMELPAKVLAIKGETAGASVRAKETLPEVGDPVDFHVRGSVSAVDADGRATVRVAFVNGARVELPAVDSREAAEDEAALGEEDEEGKLMRLAGESDRAQGFAEGEY